jgi:hypothetical protein
MVQDVFDAQGIAGLKGWMGVGHGALALPHAYPRYRHVTLGRPIRKLEKSYQDITLKHG